MINWNKNGLGLIVLGLLSLFISSIINITDEFFIIHGLWCIISFIFISLPLFKYISKNIDNLVYDHRILLSLSYIFYFLFGAALVSFGSDNELLHANNEYPINLKSTLLVDSINSIGFGISLLSSTYCDGFKWQYKFFDTLSFKYSNINKKQILYLILFIGFYSSIYVSLDDFGYFENRIGGIWRTLEKISLVGIFLSLITKENGYTFHKYISFTLVFYIFSYGIISFSKTKILTAIFLLLLSTSIRFNKLKLLIISLPLLFIVLNNLGGAVNYSRVTIGNQSSTSLEQRWEIFKTGTTASIENIEAISEYSAWSRISYVAAQTGAIDFYNIGQGGEEFALIPWLFVPRILVSSKPNITESNGEFYYKLSGFEGSATGQGIFVSGYYNLGWLGVIFVSILTGFIFSQTSIFSYYIFKYQSIVLTPVICIGLFMAFRIDGSFISDQLGIYIMVAYISIFLYLISTYIKSSSHSYKYLK